MNAIEKVGKQELAWNGRPVRNTEQDATVILAPMFAAYPNTNADDATFEIYVKMLRDIDPQRLADAVLKAMSICKFLPTVADIREQLEQRAPGPRSDVDPHQLPDIPKKMYRPDPETDRQERLERLRQTRKWDGKYA
jgi:hypothetical protein